MPTKCRFILVMLTYVTEPTPSSINPFSSAYWVQEQPPQAAGPITVSMTGSMNPPRLPLQPRPNIANSGSVKMAPSATAPKAPKRLIPAELMEDFKAAINGSDLTKLALVEALKKQFSKVPKDAITNTLNAVAVREGSKNAEKRWKLI